MLLWVSFDKGGHHEDNVQKSVLAFLTCVLALAFALTGCSGGKDPKANFVGSWKLSGGTTEGEELTDEYMDMFEEWGISCILVLDEDGTGSLDLFSEVSDLKWEAKDATTASITVDKETTDVKLKDGKLILEEDDGNLVFTKSDKDLSGTVKKDREAAEKEEEIDEAVEDDDVQKIEISPPSPLPMTTCAPSPSPRSSRTSGATSVLSSTSPTRATRT